MNLIPAQIGDSIDQIETPALVVDLDAFDRNVKRMAGFGRESGMRIRPHAKTHKCPSIARRQIAAGAVGQCCQKVGEAEALVRGGVDDVLVTNEVIGAQKLRRLAALATEATIGLCFDAKEQIEAASRAALEFGVTLDALVEVDVGMQRCGIAPGVPVRELAQRITEAPGLAFRGLQAYHGEAQHLPTSAEREAAIARAAEAVQATREALDQVGLTCAVVSGAGTGTFRLESATGLWNELQVGSYVFMDTEYARIGAKGGGPFAEFEHSLFVLSTVMSVPSAEYVVVDAGLKSYSCEKGMPWVHHTDDVSVVGVSDEHGKLRIGPKGKRLRLGDRVMLVPSHCDPTVNLHDWYVGIRNEKVEVLWPISARGASI
jgi:3-hydroxy-D-aspartate aldolase